MAEYLALVPAGSQYNNLRGMLSILSRYFPDLYESELNKGRVQGWIDEIDRHTAGDASARDADQIRDDIARVVIGAERIASTYNISLYEANLVLLGGNEGGINFHDLPVPTSPTTPGVPTPPGPVAPAPPSPPPIPDVPTPDEPATPTPEPIDWRARAAALLPYLPPALLDVFATNWERSGDANLALAETRSDPRYDSFFPGIKREDGSLRLSESEYLSRVDGYKLALGQYGLNPGVFQNQFVGMIEGELTVPEFAARLGAAYDQILGQMPEVREFYAAEYGLALSDQAIFASFIDPEIGNAVLERRITSAQIGGAGLAQGFGVDLAYAESLRERGVSGSQAQQFFGEAAFQIPVLDRLAGRFGVDRDVDLGEFTQASIFADPAQRRRFDRLRRAESSTFTDQSGVVARSEDRTIRGLSQR